MVQRSLISYVRTLISQGYDATTIKNTLLRAGYSTYEAQEALNAARQKPITKPLIILFIALLGLAILTLLLIRVLTPAQAQLEMAVSTYNTRIAPGEQLMMNIAIENPTGKKTKAIIDVRITGPATIQIPSQTITVKERASVPITATIPAGSPAGQYLAYITLAYDGRQETQTESFEVTTKPTEQKPTIAEYVREEQAREQQKTCPGGCDDLNPCTTDRCVEGQCEHTPKTPCCGNGICEPGEEGTCADCAPDVIEDAKSLAKANPSSALKKCAESRTPDACIKEVASIANDKTMCDRISSAEIKDACLIHFAFAGDYTVCEQIQGQLTKNSCYTLKNLAKYK